MTNLAPRVMAQPVADYVCHDLAARERAAMFRRLPLLIVIFPNTVFIMQDDHPETWRVRPGASPDASRMDVSLYILHEALAGEL